MLEYPALYARHEWHHENCAEFVDGLKDFSLKLFHPSPDKAPWHLQAYLNYGGHVVVVNFWPHTLKAQRDGCHSVQGVAAIREMLVEAISDAQRPAEDFDLIADE